jgi:hypothetical protein
MKKECKMNFLQALQVGIGASQSVMQLVQHVEGPGNGPIKRDIVMKMAYTSTKMAFEMANGEIIPDVEKNALVMNLGILVDVVVDFYNQVGVFRKTRGITVEAKNAEKYTAS